MAYHTIGNFQKRVYFATNDNSGAHTTVGIVNRCKLVEVVQTFHSDQTAAAGMWSMALNNNTITGLSSVAVSSGLAHVAVNITPAPSNLYFSRGDNIAITPSSMHVSNWNIVVQEF